MREMKDSGVEWIGEIPKEWEIRRIKHIASLAGRIGWQGLTSDEYSDDGAYLITGVDFINGRIDWNSCVHVPMSRWEEATQIQIKEGDLLITKDGTVGKVAIAENIPGKTSLNSGVLLIRNYDVCNTRFLFWMIQSEVFWKWFGIINAGNSTIIHLYQHSFANFGFPFPDESVQKKVATYLDSKCSKIDEIVAKQKQIIEKLKEYKLSVITEIVTKGLNPEAEMKDSGVEWIGTIPKHWTISKLKFLFGSGDDGLKIGPFGSAMKGKTLEAGPYKIYNQAHLIQNDFSLNRHFVSEETFKELVSYEVKPDDILFSMMGTIGKCQIMPSGYPKGIMDSHLLKARLNGKILPRFFVYAYDKDLSNQVIHQLLYVSNGTIMNGLNSTILKNVVIALPPVKEQKGIIEHLDGVVQEIDSRIEKVVLIVEKLHMYKKSLIYEVVTGKMEV